MDLAADADVRLDPTDTLHLRAAIALSAEARDAGNMPYGALLVAADGRVLAVARNTQVSERHCTGHAETNLMREATHRFDAATLAGSTVYASGEPCAMCAGAIYWGGIRRARGVRPVNGQHARTGRSGRRRVAAPMPRGDGARHAPS